jgi:hypothetical protein
MANVDAFTFLKCWLQETIIQRIYLEAINISILFPTQEEAIFRWIKNLNSETIGKLD